MSYGVKKPVRTKRVKDNDMEYWARMQRDYKKTPEDMKELAKNYKDLLLKTYELVEDAQDKGLTAIAPIEFTDALYEFRNKAREMMYQTERYVKTEGFQDKKMYDHVGEEHLMILEELKDYLESEVNVFFEGDENGWYVDEGMVEDPEGLIYEGNKWLKIKYPKELKKGCIEILETQGVIRLVCNE